MVILKRGEEMQVMSEQVSSLMQKKMLKLGKQGRILAVVWVSLLKNLMIKTGTMMKKV